MQSPTGLFMVIQERSISQRLTRARMWSFRQSRMRIQSLLKEIRMGDRDTLKAADLEHAVTGFPGRESPFRNIEYLFWSLPRSFSGSEAIIRFRWRTIFGSAEAAGGLRVPGRIAGGILGLAACWPVERFRIISGRNVPIRQNPLWQRQLIMYRPHMEIKILLSRRSVGRWVSAPLIFPPYLKKKRGKPLSVI